jgi:arylsulfatase A-like enzyme
VGLQHETKNPFLMGYQTIVADESFRRCAELTPKIDILFQSFSEDSTPWWVTIGTKEIHRSWGIRGTLVDPSTVHVPAYLPDTPQARKDLAGFLGDLHAYDTFIGSVYDLLTKYHLLESTIVIVTTDHGIALPHAKGTLYDPGIQTLMIWSSPKIIPAGQRISTLVSSLDFAPTICELCDIDSHPEFTGKSYAAALRGETLEDTAIHDYIFAEKDFADIYDPIRAIRSPQFKYIRNYTTIPVFDMPPRDIRWGSSYKSWKKQLKNSTRAKEEFYDLTADPLEQQNLILTHPAIPEIQHMRSILDDHLEQINDLIRFGTYPAQFHASIDNARKFPHLKDYY